MKSRRDFLKRTGMAALATPFAAFAFVRGKQLFADDIPALESVKPLIESEKATDFFLPDKDYAGLERYDDMKALCTRLAKHFGRHEHWMESTEYEETWKGPCKVDRFQFSERGCTFSGLSSVMCLDPGVKVSIAEESHWVYIHHYAPSGRELNWYWRPATPFEINGGPEYPVMGVDQLCPTPNDGKLDVLYYRVEAPNFVTTGTTHDWRYLDVLMSRHKIKMCVIDRYPESYLAQKFADRYPGFVKIAKHVRGNRYPLYVSDQCPDTVQINAHDYFKGVPTVSHYNLQPCTTHQEFARRYCQVARDIIEGNYWYAQHGVSRQVCDYFANKVREETERKIMKGARTYV